MCQFSSILAKVPHGFNINTKWHLISAYAGRQSVSQVRVKETAKLKISFITGTLNTYSLHSLELLSRILCLNGSLLSIFTKQKPQWWDAGDLHILIFLREKEWKELLAHKLLRNHCTKQYFVGHTSQFLSSSHHNCFITWNLKNYSKYPLTLSWDFPQPNLMGVGLSRSNSCSSEVPAVGCQEMAHLWLLQKVSSIQTAHGFGQPVSPANNLIICFCPKWTCSVVGHILPESNIEKKENNPHASKSLNQMLTPLCVVELHCCWPVL